jgi:hypothetical protein
MLNGVARACGHLRPPHEGNVRLQGGPCFANDQEHEAMVAASNTSESSSDSGIDCSGGGGDESGSDAGDGEPLVSLHDALRLMTAAADSVDAERAAAADSGVPRHGLEGLSAPAMDVDVPAGEELLLVGRVSSVVDGVVVVKVLAPLRLRLCASSFPLPNRLCASAPCPFAGHTKHAVTAEAGVSAS